MRFKRRMGAFLLGAVCVAGFAPFHLFLLPILSLAGLIRLWSDGRKDSFGTGFFFGLGFFLFGVSWVYVSLHEFGGMPMPLAILATCLFCAFLSLYFAIAGAISDRIPDSKTAKPTLFIPALLALADWLRGWLFTGFPWLAFGYAQTDYSPLSGYAPILGVYGISLVSAFCAGLVHLILKKEHIKSASIAIAIVFAIGYGLEKMDWTRPEGKPVTVSLLQGNIPQDRKWNDEALSDTLDIYMRLALSSRSRLIILPETAIPMFKNEVPEEYLEMLRIHGMKNRGDILVGLPEQISDKVYYNSVFDFGSSPELSYRKSHLVPFGEYLPLKPFSSWLLDLMNMPMSDFSRGRTDQKPMDSAGQKLAIDICYEDVFGEEVIRQLPEATMLVNVSDDAWFGDSIAPRQHLQIAQMRSMETGRTMLRSTNTGMTAIIDQKGHIVSELAPFTRGTLDGLAQGYSGSTPYILWGNHAFLLLDALMLLAILRRNK
jgi:apolipoprotein N-acyltransferase